jgi:NADPH-dependent glutamate synthase beta subunit-like oxidoreductase
MSLIENSPLWTTNTSEVCKTGTWRSAVPVYRTVASPCHGACPVNGEIAIWIQQVIDADYQKAWLTLVQNNPFPAIAGRICHHPCETVCNRKYLDETVGICDLERFVGDMALSKNWQYPKPDKISKKKIAIVGSGPAGLSAAYQLRRNGFLVSLFESKGQLGGLMRYGIPAYRLDKAILDAEIQRIINMGVEVHLHSDIGDKAKLQQLRDQFDAVFLATGATRSKTLANLDYQKSWVKDSADFLAASNYEETDQLGERILVIGGGSAALDVARTARRLGKTVTILSLEPEELLPAQKLEVDEAKEEGIDFVTASMLQTATENTDGITLNCITVDFKQGENHGEFSVTPIVDSEFILSVDSIIPAIGQDVDLELWNGLLDSAGAVIKTDEQWQTSLPGVFAGGDFATLDRFVTEAIGIGKHAATAIARYVENKPPTKSSTAELETPYSEINTYYHPEVKRHRAINSNASVRLQNFQEVQQGLSHQAAVAESKRCFSCGSCTYCDSCYFHCPDMAIAKLEKGYTVKTDYCKGCGLCVAECPTGSIAMQEEM